MTGIVNDLRFALRMIRKRPTASAVIVLILALGIAANTLMFTGFDAWVLRPLPFEDPGRLVALMESHPSSGRGRAAVSPANLRDWQEQQRVLTDIGAYRRRMFNLNADGEPHRIDGVAVSASLLPLLGIEAARGRTFLPEEDQPGGPLVALLGHTLWQQRFGADPSVVGTTFLLDGRAHQVIGVMPAGFKFPGFAELWIPLATDPDSVPRDRRNLGTVARLAPGVTVAAASQELSAIASRLATSYPETDEGWTALAVPLREDFVPPVIRVALAASLATGFLVLLIICSNVANLMLAQATARKRETAMRVALGASRGRLVRQTLTESMLLALAAGGLGVLLGKQGLAWMENWAPVEPPYMFAFGTDGRVLLYTLLISVVTGVVCGLAPVLRTAAVNVGDALRSSGSRSATGYRVGRLRNLLVVGELAVSLLLVVGALLTVKSYLKRQEVVPGYRIENVLTLELSLSEEGRSGEGPQGRVAFLEEALDALAEIPGVESAGAVDLLPLTGRGYRAVRLEVDGQPRKRGEEPETTLYAMTQGYLESLNIPLLQGRLFTTNEQRQGDAVVLVSELLGRSLWPGDSAVGKRIRVLDQAAEEWLTVVGVVGTIDPGRPMVSSAVRPRSQIYVPYSTAPSTTVAMALHSPVDPEILGPEARRRVGLLDSGVAVSHVRPMEDVVYEMQWVASYFSKLFSLYAFIALAVAALGVYGVTADSVAGRVREMGIRLAVGASPRGLVGMVVREGLVLGAAGVVIGLLVTLPLTGLLSATLFAVSARDPVVFGGVALLLGATACLASYLPARRAARIDPMDTLRFE